MQGSVRILAIAPYEGMKEQLLETAREFPEVEMVVIVGDLDVGLNLTMNRLQSDYDVLLSRGGTAKLLRQFLTLPVVEIKISGNDILRALKLANAHYGRSAVVGFPNITHEMEKLQGLLPYPIDTYPINNTEEALAILDRLTNSDYAALLCDMVTHTAASKLGLNTFLITSGAESIREAIQSALFIYQANRQLQLDNQFFRTLLQHQDSQTVVFSETGKLVYATRRDEKSELLHLLRSQMQQLPETDGGKLVLQSQGVRYQILPRRIQVQDQRYIAFHYTALAVSDTREKKGILYRNREQVEALSRQGIHALIEFPPGVVSQLRHAATQPQPILLVGEPGAGQRAAAHRLYLSGIRSDHPLIEIDCTLLRAKNWSYLLNHHRSPLYDAGNTLYFANAEALSADQLQSLCLFFASNNALKQNAILLSASAAQGEELAPAESMLTAHLACRILSLPPLRSFPQLIARLVHRYLAQAAIGLPAPLLDAQALQLLRSYSWPQNYRQLFRVLEQITVLAAGDTVTAETVQEALGQEVFLVSAALPDRRSAVLDISRPLAEIERTIARILLENNGGNHSQTAASLGIGRSTLWRMLKE